ncbi:aminotransferase [Ilyonectria robusta]|uniref:aminotransferase n=1 Tax=Ilyonectria robusta TaxID=1079257 RepID=UPI001E8CD01C|nr:aminotransferase [Ilyonectria robusta]KAH8699804.1 aminotransferase [Ilyonectria robusta]
MNNEFSLFTSLRYDSRLREVPSKGLIGEGWNFENESSLYMLDFHRDRMLRAATHWKWQAAIDALAGDDGLQKLARLTEEVIGSTQTSPLRVRILVSREGEIEAQKFDTPELPLENLFPERLPPPGSSNSPGDPKREGPFALLVDHAVTPRSEYTHYKTTKREMYDSARQRANISPTDPKELLIINKDDGSVMEGTITTPYFWRHGQWVTPTVAANFSWEDGSGGQDGTSRRWSLERGLATEQVVKADSLVDGEECWISNGVRGFVWTKISLKDQQQ